MSVKNGVEYILILVCLFAVGAFAETITLKASKDNFGRSNKRNRNNGANDTLYVAHAPNIRTIIAFDLSPVTNRIEKATFRFQQADANANPVTMAVAPMIYTEGNAAWIEGAGALGTKGQNAKPGESCYAWRAFPDSQWEKSSEEPVTDLGDAQLWGKPLVSGKRMPWEEGGWVEIEISNVALLEEIRSSTPCVVTLGLWGTSGNGLYGISSRESGNAPELVVVIKDAEE